ncbi:MAG: hypothetical protein JNK37_21205 [Verrucomicrobiales bacterium]|nr:hypothetical protein [Verrucomicrobiales bacterium]
MATQIQPVDLLDLKTLRPTELRTAEWSRVDQWARERAFYMAGVAEAETLQEMRELVRLNATGQAGEFELLKRWEAFLDRKGYTPEPGQEGTIKDLRSLRRFNVALRTNTALLHEWAAKENDLRPGPMRAFPAWELVRLKAARVPRDWPARWVRAGGVLTDDGRMIAGKLDEVWPRLGDRSLFADALGVDYPPLAWGSGMGRRGVGARECLALGVLTKEDIEASVAYVKARPLHSPSEGLQATPRVTDRDLREDLGEKLQGLARWEGKTLVFTDPNGTRPATQAELLEMWSRPLPEKFRTEAHPEGLLQKDALKRFVEQNDRFRDAADTDRWEDLVRLHARLVNDRERDRLHRGLRLRDAEIDGFLSRIQKTGYGVRPAYPVESWTASPAAAERFAKVGRIPDGQWSVLLSIDRPERVAFKDISTLVRTLRREINLETASPLETESEWLLAAGWRFVVKDILRDAEARVIRILLSTTS